MAVEQKIIDAVRNGEVVAVYFVDTTETLGGTIKEVVPYVQAGISYVVVDRYLHTVMSNMELDLPLEEYEDLLINADNDTIVEIGSQRIHLFVVDLVEAE